MEKTATKKKHSGILRLLWVTHVLLLFTFASVPAKAVNLLQGYRINLNLSNVSIKNVIEEIKNKRI